MANFLNKVILKIKKHFSFITNKENNEKGIGVTGVILATAGIVALTSGIYGWLFGDGFLTGVATAFGTIFLSFGGGLLNLASVFLTYVLNPSFTNQKIVQDPVFNSAWASVRDMSNMLIVLGFVIVGIATTLRIRDYEAKKVLPKLIFIALFINFSGFMCEKIIQGADIVTTALLQQGSAAGNFGAITGAINSYVSSQTAKNGGSGEAKKTANDPAIYLGKTVVLCIFEIFCAYMFFILAVLMASRYAVLAVLYILSPLAFVASIFDATKKYWSKWWEAFIQWSFLGVTSSFFIYLAVNTLYQSGANINFQRLSVCLIFLYIGYKMAKSGSAIGSGAILGLASTGAKMAMGGALAGAAALGGVTGVTGLAKRAGTAVKDQFTSAGESLNLVNKGTTKNNQQNRLKESTSRLSGAYENTVEGNTKLAAISTGPAYTHQQVLDKAAAGAVLADRKALNYIPKEKQAGVAAYSTSFGSDKAKFDAANPALLAKPDASVAKQRIFEEHVANLEKSGKSSAEAKKIAKAELGTGVMSQIAIKTRLKTNPISQTTIEAKQREMVGDNIKQNKIGYADPTDKEVQARAAESQTFTAIQIADAQKKMDAKNRATMQPGSGVPLATTEADAKKYLQDTYKPSATDTIKTREIITKERMKEKALGFSHASRNDAINSLVDAQAKVLRAGDASKNIPALSGAGFDNALTKYKSELKDDEINKERSTINETRQKEAVGRLSGAKAAELPKQLMEKDVVRHFDENQMTNIYRNAAPEVVTDFNKAIKQHANTMKDSSGKLTKEGETFVIKAQNAAARAKRY
jgi:hypothetical protein